MPRKPRIEYEGAFYHVISRGNRGESVFLDDKDKVRFLNKLQDYKGILSKRELDDYIEKSKW